MSPSAPRSADAPWWAGGLPFSCTRCGKCCTARGEYQHVYVNRAERRRLAAYLNLSEGELTQRYTSLDSDGYRTLRFEAGACIFLDGTECRVHDAKPVQCRTWPFWSELLESRAVYQREVMSFCPGSREGTIVPGAEIGRQMRETEKALWQV